MKSITDFGLALLAPILPNKDVIGGNMLRDTLRVLNIPATNVKRFPGPHTA